MDELSSTTVSVDKTISKSSDLAQHFKIEESTLKKLLQLDREYRKHYEMHLREMLNQENIIKTMAVISQAYINARKNGPCCETSGKYNENVDDRMEEYYWALEQIRSSCCRLLKSITNLRVICLEFQCLCSQLNMTVKSRFMQGDHIHKPITYFMKVVDNIFRYFHARALKLDVSAHQMDPEEMQCIAYHKTLLEKNEDFNEYFNTELGYCKCLRRLKC